MRPVAFVLYTIIVELACELALCRGDRPLLIEVFLYLFPVIRLCQREHQQDTCFLRV